MTRCGLRGFVRAECANYVAGICVFLGGPCPVESGQKGCAYFEAAVLPLAQKYPHAYAGAAKSYRDSLTQRKHAPERPEKGPDFARKARELETKGIGSKNTGGSKK